MPLFQSIVQRRWVLFAVVFLSAAIGKAAMITSDRDAFPGLLSSGYYGSSFQNFTTGDQFATTTGDLAGTGNLSAGSAFHFTITTPPGLVSEDNTLWVVTPISGGDYPRGHAMSTRLSDFDLILTFTSGNVSAVGASFSLTDANEDQVAGTFDITLSDSTVINNISSPTDGSVPFRGFRTDGTVFITSLTFHPDSGYAMLDDLYVGAIAPVPEPAATGIAAGLLCLLVAGRGVLMRVWSKLHSRAA